MSIGGRKSMNGGKQKMIYDTIEFQAAPFCYRLEFSD